MQEHILKFLEILSHFSKEDYSKLPKDKIEFYRNNMDKNYEFSINPEIDLSKQYISEEANAILISLFRDYFASDKQKKTLANLLDQNQEKIAKEKTEQNNLNNLFKNNKNNTVCNIEKEQSLTFIKGKETKWYKKPFTFLINFIKSCR